MLTKPPAWSGVIIHDSEQTHSIKYGFICCWKQSLCFYSLQFRAHKALQYICEVFKGFMCSAPSREESDGAESRIKMVEICTKFRETQPRVRVVLEQVDKLDLISNLCKWIVTVELALSLSLSEFLLSSLLYHLWRWTCDLSTFPLIHLNEWKTCVCVCFAMCQM